MIRWTACLLPLWLFVAVAWAADDADPDESESVGRRGDPAKFSYQGATAFTPAQLSRALKYDMDFLSATREKNPMSALLEMTAQRIREGYRHYGFADAKVDATLTTDGGVRVQIHEGPRYQRGGIEIKAPAGFPADSLRQWFSESHPREDDYSRKIETPTGVRTQWFATNGEPVEPRDPFWPAGKDAPFDAMYWTTLENHAQQGLRSLGYRRANPHVRVERSVEGEQHRGTLVVDVTELGPRAIIDAIEINGLERNSKAEVLKYLDIKPRAVFDTALEHEIIRKLRTSGRFLTCKAETSSTSPDGLETLAIDVEEFDLVPPIGEPLRPEQEVMRRCAEWLMTFPARDHDAVITSKEEGLEGHVIISPQRGMWSSVKVLGETGEPLVWYEFLASERRDTHCLPASRVKAVVPMLQSRLGLRVEMRVDPDRTDEDDPFTLRLGMEARERWDAHLPGPLYCAFLTDPVALMGMVSGDEAEFEIRDDYLEFRVEEGLRLRIGVSDGRLIEAFLGDEEGHVRLTIEEGAFQKCQEEFVKRTADFEDWSKTNCASDIAARFVSKTCEGLADSHVGFRFAHEILERMRNAHAFDCLDELHREISGASSFEIPHHVLLQHLDARELQREAGRGNTWFWMMINDKIVPPGHWTRRFIREIHLEFSRHQEKAGIRELARSHEVGPVHRLLSSQVATLILPFPMGPWFAGGALMVADGSDRLTLREFRHDIQLFCDPGFLPGQFVRAAASELREMSDADYQKLLGSMGEFPERKTLLRGFELLRASRAEPLNDALPKVLEKWWDEGLQDLTREQLKSLYQQFPSAGKREST